MKTLIIEGRYDSLVRGLSNQLLNIIKQSYSSVSQSNGEFSGQKIYFAKGESIPNIDDDSQFKHIYFQEVENLQIPLDFYLTLKVQWIEGLNDFRFGGDAYNQTGRESDEMPLIEVRFEIDPAEYPNILNEISMQLRDTLRHEIEHITQSGWNTVSGKYLASDQALRTKIASGKLPPWRYFILPKEIPAMIQGMYLKAKKSRTPFKTVVHDYLDIWVSNNTISEQEKQQIIDTWKPYLTKLGIRQEL